LPISILKIFLNFNYLGSNCTTTRSTSLLAQTSSYREW